MENLLNCAMDIGEQMLVSGAEIHRVEDSINRMCLSFGAARADVFIITTSMIVTVTDKDGKTLTKTRRVERLTTDFERIHRLNQLSRQICEKKLSAEEIKAALDNIEQEKNYPFWVQCIGMAIISGSFTLFFGGTVTEMLVALLIGALVRIGILFSEKVISNAIFSKFLSAVIAAVLALAALKLGIITAVDKVIIGNIMTLIPGIGLTNAMRDLFTGDGVSGMLRTVEAVLTAFAIAAGYFAVSILGGLQL